jgi:hypothetical protein
MSFAQWQPEYASRGLPTFPVKIVNGNKRPAVKNYLRTGQPYSARLAKQFPDAQAFGFALGDRTKITVLDCDSNDEKILADAMSKHGKTPLIVRSGSGNYQGWYRHNGERRHIRPDPKVPVDILGAGFVVAPPSKGGKSPYQIISGSLDDLDNLPALAGFVDQIRPAEIGRLFSITPSPLSEGAVIGKGKRNAALFRECLKQAPACDDFAALLDVAQTFASQCEPSAIDPMTEDEIVKTAASAWQINERGDNRIAKPVAAVPIEWTDRFIGEPPFLGFLTWLVSKNGPQARFMIADALAPKIGFSLPLLRRCRKRALDEGVILQVSRPHNGHAAFYCWARADLSKSVGLTAQAARRPRKAPKDRGEGVGKDSLPKTVGLPSDGSEVLQ